MGAERPTAGRMTSTPRATAIPLPRPDHFHVRGTRHLPGERKKGHTMAGEEDPSPLTIPGWRRERQTILARDYPADTFGTTLSPPILTPFARPTLPILPTS